MKRILPQVDWWAVLMGLILLVVLLLLTLEVWVPHGIGHRD
jgi:hypothetical protein